MKGSSLVLLGLLGTCTMIVAAEPQAPCVVRTISSANPEPPMFDWHPHNKMGIARGAFAGVQSFNRVLIREESGDVVAVPFFHFTARDLGELMNQMAKFPAETRVMDYPTGSAPIVELKPAELKLGPVELWPNHGVLGGSFHSMNVPPVVEDIQGRRAVHFDANFWYFDTQYNAMVLDAMPANALKDGMPFTLSAWVLHPKEPDGDDCEMIMSWHTRSGNNGSGLDWKRGTCWGDFYIAGMGGDVIVEPKYTAQPMKEWTHVAYVYTGGGLKGELRVFENGRLTGIARSPFVPELRDPVNITADSVVLKGYLNTISNGVVPYVRGYIGEYDAHHFGQLRHIGQWAQMNEIGLTPGGEFSIPFKNLKPGTRYYYRMFATFSPESYTQCYEPTRRWANGAGSFVTATADGKPGKIIPGDTDRYLFLGVQWGSRWYTSYSGPAGLFRGYIGDLKLYDRALSDDEIRLDAHATAVFDGMPADGGTTDLCKVDFSWKSGTASATDFRFYLDTDRTKVENGSASMRQTKATALAAIELKPGRMHFWRVDALDAAGTVLATGPVWQVKVSYGEPALPTPQDGSKMSATRYFHWNNTINTLKEQRFYIGQDAATVATSTVPAMKLDGGAREYFARAEDVFHGATFCWRIETVLDDGAVVPGPVWSFTTHDYFTPEWDGPAAEPYLMGVAPSRCARLMDSMGYPTISTPRADEETLRDIQHATERYLRKSTAMRNRLASFPCATTMSSPEGPPCVDGFACGSYGGMPIWDMTMHEMGHQIHGFALAPMDPEFNRNLNMVFNSHADNNAWLGDYAACNIAENMAVNCQGFTHGLGREELLRDDPPTFFLLSNYLPGDLAVELHPAFGLSRNASNEVVCWANRGGIEDRKKDIQGYGRVPEMIGAFSPVGAPKVKTVQGATAVTLDGSDALVWDKQLQCGFVSNRSWSVEFWARRDASGTGAGLLLGWGPEQGGVRLYWGAHQTAWNISGNKADWPAKPKDGEWQHLAFVFEGGGLADTNGPMRLFVNGREVIEKSYKLVVQNSMPVEIGGEVKDGKAANGFCGAMAHVRVYNYAISREQVVGHYTQERRGYERTPPRHIGGNLYVDLDATQLEETGTEDHQPLYHAGLRKPWVRSWANKGTVQGRVHNDVDTLWHYSGSTPLYREVGGIQALLFMGKDRMVGVMEPNGVFSNACAGTLEATVYSEAQSPDEVVLEWGEFALDARLLKHGWQHVAVNADGGRSIVFVDGVRTGELVCILKPGPREHLHLGAHFDPRRESWYRYFNGAIAGVRVHEHTLTPEQIAANAKASPVCAAHTPSPADGARIAAARMPALTWKQGRSTAAQQVLLGDDPAKLAVAGSFKPGEFKPRLADVKRYFWRVGNGPVWSFETTQGELVSLSAKGLAAGPLAVWKNNGTAGGSFKPADRGNLLGIDVEQYNGKKVLRLEQGRKMTFRRETGMPEALAKGPFTIVLHVASDNATEVSPVLAWGATGSVARLWFGTWSADRRLLTIGGTDPLNINDQHPPEQLKLIYPMGHNAQMAFAWKTLAITYANGHAELWYNRRKIDSREVNLGVGGLGDLVLGWDSPACNGSILLNDLRVYDRVVSQADIERLVKGEAISGAGPMLRIGADDLAPGTRVAVVKNTGSVNGSFISEPEVNRAPQVGEVAGRPAVKFNGVAMLSSDFILPEALADAKPFTVEMWALQDEPSRDMRVLAFSQEISQRYTAFAMGSTADPKAIARLCCGADWQVGGEEKPGQWVHLAWVYDGGQRANIRLYRNGKLNAEGEFKTVDTIGGYPMTIGGVMSPAVAEKFLFKGAIADIRVFDYPRTGSEIAKDAGVAAKEK